MSQLANRVPIVVATVAITMALAYTFSATHSARSQEACTYMLSRAPTSPFVNVYVEGYACSEPQANGTWRTRGWTRTFNSSAYPVNQYSVAASIYGYDRCGNGSWLWKTNGYRISYNGFWSNWADGYGLYEDCDELNPHAYRIHAWHYHQPTSSSWTSQAASPYWYH